MREKSQTEVCGIVCFASWLLVTLCHEAALEGECNWRIKRGGALLFASSLLLVGFQASSAFQDHPPPWLVRSLPVAAVGSILQFFQHLQDEPHFALETKVLNVPTSEVLAPVSQGFFNFRDIRDSQAVPPSQRSVF